MIGEDLLRFNNQQKYCVIDTETFNLCLMHENPPWQVGWLITTKDKILSSHNHFINWQDRFRMSQGARIATGYDHSVILTKGETPELVWSKLEVFLNDPSYIFVAHNFFGFDYHILNQWARYIGKPSIEFILSRAIDTNCLAKAIKLGLKIQNEDRLGFQLKMSSFHKKGIKTSLGTLVKEYQINLGNEKFHTADFDILANYEIFKKQLWEIDIK